MTNCGPEIIKQINLEVSFEIEYYKHPKGLVDRKVTSNGKLKTIFDPICTLL